MSKTIIELTKDVWNYGCKGDVITVAKEDLAKLDALGEKAGAVYKNFVDAAVRSAKAVEAEIVSDVKGAKASTKGAAKAVEADAESDVQDVASDAEDTAKAIETDSSIK